MGTLVAESEKAPKIEPCLTSTTSNSLDKVVENPKNPESEVCLMNQVVVENAETPKIEPFRGLTTTTTNQVVENPKTPESEVVLLYLTDNQVVMENAETPLESEICLITNQMIVENANTPDTGICLTNKAFSEDNCESSSSPVKITTELLVNPSSSSSVVVHAPPPPSSSGALVPGDDKVKKALYKFGQRTSNFRGVTRHRWTGKFEAHLWDNTSISETRKRKGKQVYLGGYETEEKAAVAYDLAALKFWGAAAHSKLNFPISKYEKEIEEMIDMSKEEYINSLRRQSICFARGNSNYRGVTRQHEGRRWQARIGRVAGGRDIYLGTYDTEEEAAEAYDIAAVKLRGMGAITNFHISNYYKEGSKELDILPISAEEERPPVRIRRFKITTA